MNAPNITDRDGCVAAVQGLRGSAAKNSKGNDCADNAAAMGASPMRLRRTADDSAADDTDRQRTQNRGVLS